MHLLCSCRNLRRSYTEASELALLKIIPVASSRTSMIFKRNVETCQPVVFYIALVEPCWFKNNRPIGSACSCLLCLWKCTVKCCSLYHGTFSPGPSSMIGNDSTSSCQSNAGSFKFRTFHLHFTFALSIIGTVSTSFRDLTISCVVALYFLK